MSEPRDDYLWDRSGPVDPDVERLEDLLGRFGHDGRPASRARRRRPWRLGVLLAVAAALVLVWWVRGPGAAVRLVADGKEIAPGEVFVATGGDRELVLGESLAWLTLREGSRLRVDRVGRVETRLALEEGGLQALVSVDARPRFFQVQTPSTRCVDLGCFYSLNVTPQGDAHVLVTLGRVAFEDNGREVYVPQGAECYAVHGRGAGTPRFLDASASLVEALDAFDAADDRPASERLALARSVLEQAGKRRDALVVWHLLQDPDPAVATLAIGKLEGLVGRPEGVLGAAGTVPAAADRERWKAHLGWW